MRKFCLKKSTVRLSLLFTLLLAAFIIHSCKKDNRTTGQVGITDPDVMAAQAWYNSSYLPAVNTGSSGSGTAGVASSAGSISIGARSLIVKTNAAQEASKNWSKVLSPYWNKATAFISKKGLSIVEVPALKNGDMAFSKTMPGDASKFDFGQSNSLTSLLIIKQDKQYAIYAMTFLADDSYLKGDYIKLTNNTYRKRDKDYTGWVFYHQLDGTFVNGWRYVNGVVTASAKPSVAPASLLAASTGTTATATANVARSVGPRLAVTQTCDYVLVYQIWQECLVNQPTVCTYWAQYMGYYVTCSDDPGGDPGDGPAAPAPPAPKPCVVPAGPGTDTVPAAAIRRVNSVSLKTAGSKTAVAQTPPPTDPTDPDGPILPPILCPTQDPVDTTKKTPCDQANLLANNPSFKTLMTSLQKDTAQKSEVGYTYTLNADGSVNASLPLSGPANSDSLTIHLTVPIDGILHTHFAGLYPTFSPKDISDLYQIMLQGGIKDINTFTMGLITPSGTYLIKINNASLFATYGAINYSSPTTMNAAENNYDLSQLIYSSNGNTASYELALLSVLNNSGLTVFKGNSSFNSWTPIIKQNNKVTLTNCN